MHTPKKGYCQWICVHDYHNEHSERLGLKLIDSIHLARSLAMSALIFVLRFIANEAIICMKLLKYSGKLCCSYSDRDGKGCINYSCEVSSLAVKAFTLSRMCIILSFSLFKLVSRYRKQNACLKNGQYTTSRREYMLHYAFKIRKLQEAEYGLINFVQSQYDHR
jgi:hypothetical protein